MHKWFVYSEFDQASKAAADFLADKIEASIQQNGICHVVLPGGNTPKICLVYLAEKNLPWEKVHWYPGDERCLPAGDAERNDVMLEKNFWSRLPKQNFYRIPAELGADKAAEIYREIIGSVQCFDIAFLGMGEDGHTASLFPNNDALYDESPVVAVHNAPKAPGDRVSLSNRTLRHARCRVVLAGGAAKADVIARIKQDEALPINCLGDINWFVDEAAMANV